LTVCPGIYRKERKFESEISLDRKRAKRKRGLAKKSLISKSGRGSWEKKKCTIRAELKIYFSIEAILEEKGGRHKKSLLKLGVDIGRGKPGRRDCYFVLSSQDGNQVLKKCHYYSGKVRGFGKKEGGLKNSMGKGGKKVESKMQKRGMGQVSFLT